MEEQILLNLGVLGALKIGRCNIRQTWENQADKTQAACSHPEIFNLI
jgi:hypothetical protein